jgi:hypothetical protein
LSTSVVVMMLAALGEPVISTALQGWPRARILAAV